MVPDEVLNKKCLKRKRVKKVITQVEKDDVNVVGAEISGKKTRSGSKVIMARTHQPTAQSESR